MNLDDPTTFLTVLIVGIFTASVVGAFLAVGLARWQQRRGAWVISGTIDPNYVPPSTSVNGGTVAPMPVGRCGHIAPRIFPGSTTTVCALPAGHAGWHRDEDGAEWGPTAAGAPCLWCPGMLVFDTADELLTHIHHEHPDSDVMRRLKATSDAYNREANHLADARMVLDRVRDLHQPAEHRVVAYSGGDDAEWHDVEDAKPDIRCSCTGNGMHPYPCPTVIALDTPATFSEPS